MREHNGKRAVIISNIKSNSIEQAIFILKSKQTEPSSAEVSGGIVAEAQEIINSYIDKIENRSIAGNGRMRRIVAALSVLAGLAIVATATILLFG